MALTNNMTIRIALQLDEMTVAAVQKYLRENDSLGYCELVHNNKNIVDQYAAVQT